MSKVNSQDYKVVVSKGNLALKAGGDPLYSCPPSKRRRGKKLFYNGVPGQLVAFYTPRGESIPISVDDSNIDDVDGPLSFGVFIDQDGDHAADAVRLWSGDKIDVCDIKDLSVGAPKCPIPGIEAAFIDCTRCNETYTVKVKVDNNRTRSFAPFNKSAQECTASIVTECCSCDDCPADHNCKEVICKMVDALNGELDLQINDRLYPDWKGYGLERPYRAVRLHDNWFTYCLTPDKIAGACENCNTIPAITDATINGNTYTFTGNLNPADSTQTLLAQAENIAQQIEDAFCEEYGEHAGFAVVTGGDNGCCPLQLHVVTCDAAFALTGATPCPDAFDPEALKCFPGKTTCVDCDDAAPTEKKFTCGLAVISQPEKLDCNCYLEKPQAYYGQDISVEFIKDADDCTPITKSRTVQEQQIPENFGAWIQWLEYKQFPGGSGRNYRETNNHQGWLGLPDSRSRAENAISFADCREHYCTYDLSYDIPKHDSTYYKQCQELATKIAVPSCDDVTLASLEAFLTALAGKADKCYAIGPVQCIEP